MKDRQLLRLLQSDPNAGMEQLMDQYAGLVLAVVRGRLAGSVCVSSDAEDCAADVFGDFYAGLSGFDPEKASIRAYLCVLARRRAADVYRRRSRQNGVPLDEQAVSVTADTEPEDEDALRREVLSAVRALGEPDTAIIIRKYYLGESSKEIADALGLTVSNVDTRTHRALDRLRARFGGSKK